jgi:hypothetical protein
MGIVLGDDQTLTRGAPDMCRAVTCRTCGKTTWAGCGQHVDDVMRRVPSDARCEGHEGEAGAGFLARILGR